MYPQNNTLNIIVVAPYMEHLVYVYLYIYTHTTIKIIKYDIQLQYSNTQTDRNLKSHYLLVVMNSLNSFSIFLWIATTSIYNMI